LSSDSVPAWSISMQPAFMTDAPGGKQLSWWWASQAPGQPASRYPSRQPCCRAGYMRSPRSCCARSSPAGRSPFRRYRPRRGRLLDRCSRTSILGVSICDLHRSPSAGSTRAGVEASKFVADPMGPPAPCTSGPSGGLYPTPGKGASSLRCGSASMPCGPSAFADLQYAMCRPRRGKGCALQ